MIMNYLHISTLHLTVIAKIREGSKTEQ